MYSQNVYRQACGKNMIFHYLVRGVVLAGEKMLLARQIGADHPFLPGGHIEFGESAETALVREIQQEYYMEVEVVRI